MYAHTHGPVYTAEPCMLCRSMCAEEREENEEEEGGGEEEGGDGGG